MHFSRRYLGHGATALAAGAVFFLAACSSDPLDPGNGDDHADPSGVVVTLDDGLSFTYMDGDPVPAVPLTAGQAYDNVGVTFVDEDGDPVELDDDLSLELVIPEGDENILSWEPVGAGPSATPPHFRVNLQAGTAGTTTLQVRLMHDDHADWESPDLTIVVQEEGA